MNYDVLEIARYVVNYCNEHNYDITNLKLQKILYFIQANFLVNKGVGNPCFSAEIEAWSFGPVVPEVYREFKKYGNAQIPLIEKYFSFDKKNVLASCLKNYVNPFIDINDQILTNEMIDECSEYSASKLVEITHGQTPWKAVYVYNMNNVISKQSIYDYFVEE